MSGLDPREVLLGSFEAALGAADPAKVVPAHLPAPPAGRTVVVGAGKAAASMALAVEQHWPSGAPLEGIVVTRYRHGVLTNRIEVLEAAHPVPDDAGERAAREIVRRVKSLGPDDLLLALVSGGGSALLTLPAGALSMEDVRETTRALLRCGAPIQDINVVRKHISSVQGGRLAAACKAPVRSLIISDVAGDDPSHVASGPFAPDSSTYADALEVLSRWSASVPAAITEHLQTGARGEIAETPKPGDKVFARVENRVIAASQACLQAGASFFRARGIAGVVLGDGVSGEAQEVAKAYAALARQVALYDAPWKPPVALISGGELTVTVRGPGRGGRCSTFLLALGIELAGLRGTRAVHALACDTDGIDGTEDNAGAILAPDSISRAEALGLSARKQLLANDSYGFFERLCDLVVTGPTRTNVNDYRAILVA
jgi:hydroxypyruvate reductase